MIIRQSAISGQVALIVGIVLIFFSCQRFYFPTITANLSIIPLVLMVFFRKDLTLCLFCLFLALFLIVDKSEIAYTNTSTALKYFIYLLALGSIIFKKFSYSYLLFWLVWMLLLLLITVDNNLLISIDVFVRDFIFALSLLALGSKYPLKQPLPLGMVTSAMFLLSVSMIFSELINIALFYDYFGGDYLSYNPLKLLVCMASLIALIKRQFLLFVFLFLPTIYVLINFQTRMIFIFYLLCILLISFTYFRDWFKFAVVFLIGFVFIPSEVFAQFRVLNIFYYLINSDNFLALLKSLDPIRVAQHQLILGQDLFSLFFGNGMGVGSIDRDGLLDFVKLSDNAFSQDEINRNVYHRLHDSWIYITRSFGVLLYILLMGINIRAFLSSKSDINIQILSLFCVLTLNLATYATIGILAFALMQGVLIQFQRKDVLYLK